MLAIDQLNSLSESGREGLCHIARVVLEGQEKVVGLGIDTAEELFSECAQATLRLCESIDDIDPAGIAPLLMARAMRCTETMAAVTLRIGQQLQGELTVSAQAQLQALGAVLMEEGGNWAGLWRQWSSVLVESGAEPGRRMRLAA